MVRRNDYVEDEILGRLEALDKDPYGRPGYLAKISYSDDDMGEDFLQFLNIVFGNSSIKPGLKVEDISRACRKPCSRLRLPRERWHFHALLTF
ncbi:hypothetical protein [Agrobacterium tumefaciens]|uniref:hypothetical protein n=1 Tax=Agrobacterium tumefaciens TaxID=358 RepID=UPI00045A3A8F|nr:hypothetical protein [Agrobacterium tumefaciens]CDN96426.1 Ribulose bisphosphate carboxylase large chain [Agrobacterium tumefaciens]